MNRKRTNSAIEMMGRRFGSLLVTGLVEKNRPSGKTERHWSCKCEACGKEVVFSGYRLRRSNGPRDCGCRRKAYVERQIANHTFRFNRNPIYKQFRKVRDNSTNYVDAMEEWKKNTLYVPRFEQVN